MKAGVIQNKSMMAEKKLFFGKTKTLLERIHSLDDKWYVEFWQVRYYFLGIEVYTAKKEVVKHQNGKSENGNHL